MELGKIEAIESKEVTLPGLYRVTWGQGARSEVVVAGHHDEALRKIAPLESVLITQTLAQAPSSDVVEYIVEHIVEHPSLCLNDARRNGSTHVTGYTVRPLRAIR